MRTFFLSIFLVGIYSFLNAQTTNYEYFEFSEQTTVASENEVRIHLLYRTEPSLAYRLFTSLQPEKAIKLKNKDYILLVTTETAVDFFKNNKANNLPLRLNFESGKDYYFRISQHTNGYSNNLSVDELTERAFQMEIFINHVIPKPQIYNFTTLQTLN